MSFFDKLKNVFSGQERDEGIYLYVKLDRSGEVVRLRLNPQHDMNRDSERGGYVSRKKIIGPRTYKQSEATFRFNDNYQLVEWDITDGELVAEEDWTAQQETTGKQSA